ncbi:MAG: hypothetical protein HY019_11585 [Aquabacterium sp.]|uniref:hypothetical protein n=1 Tax=Aquabacterium sp. TaxID=1872578 RepID=UPI0025C559F3|nr:hypothetical protein [Aquabacterium sp.]MBI3382636.1 hypothetical protein [Aquabacterium sp.]
MSTLPLNTVTASSAQKSSSSSSTSTAQSQASSALTKISPALAKAHERIVAQAQSESTSISQLGQYKAAISSLATAANALANGSSKTTAADTVKMAERFVSAFNAAIKQANSATAANGKSQTDASRALTESKRTLSTSDASRSQLSKLGFTRQQDGTLTLDSSVLQKSLAANPDAAISTLSQLGKAMAKRAESELADKGRLNVASVRSGEKALALKQQQSALLDAATKISQAQTSSSWTTQQALQKYSAS